MKQTKIVKVEEAQNLLANIDPKVIKLAVENSMPEWVAKVNTKEDMANSMMAASQEFLAVIEDVLITQFKFTETDLNKLHNHVKPILQGVREFEHHGLSMLSPRDVAIVADEVEAKGIASLVSQIGEIRFKKERMDRAGLEYPVTMGAKPFLKALKKANKQ